MGSIRRRQQHEDREKVAEVEGVAWWRGGLAKEVQAEAKRKKKEKKEKGEPGDSRRKERRKKRKKGEQGGRRQKFFFPNSRKWLV